MNILTIFVHLFAITFADDLNNKYFPDDFMFGAGSSSYQIEGAWDEDGKGENIWDHITHKNPSFTDGGGNGDTTCDSYHNHKEDVTLLKAMNVTHYRFSIAWARILPNGRSNKINQLGVDFYNNLIDELLTENIQPMVTLYHWDLPQVLQDLGGWPNEIIVDLFAKYARLCYSLFGDRVKYWMTFNEAKQICNSGYGTGEHAPGIKSPGIGEYLCGHNVLKAHAKAWHIYNDSFRGEQKGRVGIVIDSNWYEPVSNSSTDDQEASETKLQFTFGWYANPIMNGDYPEIMKQKILNRSLAQGFKESRLPSFTEAEIADIKGTADFLGVNTYSAALVNISQTEDVMAIGYKEDIGIEEYLDDTWKKASSWFVVTPWGARKLLKWIKDTYNSPKIIITANGYLTYDGRVQDDDRINYIKQYLSSIKDAIDEDGVDVFGYTVWSLLDNLEWNFGFTNKYGLVQVDFNSPGRTRTPKNSVAFYTNLIKTRCLVENCIEK